MKKNLKIASVVAAALLAVALIAGTFVNQPVSAAVNSHRASLGDALGNFIGKRFVLIDENGNDIDFNPKEISVHVVNADGTTMKSKTIPDGQYQFEGNYHLTSIDRSSEARDVKLMSVIGNKAQVLAEFTIPADATSADGQISFSFSVKNGHVGDSSLGTAVRKVSKKSKRAKKHVRRTAKKHSRKHARRNRK